MTVVYFPDYHPSYSLWRNWCSEEGFRLVSSVKELRELDGEFLFLVSCTEIVGADIYGRFKTSCVIHESDLPKGRGWSPMAWQILEGRNRIVISAITCADKVDRGDILAQGVLELDGTELYEEINRKRCEVRRSLIKEVVEKNPVPAPQQGEPTYYPRRTPADSELDVSKSIADQFDLIRICDPRFPAFFRHRGCKYKLTLEKMA
jgi:methionyl-tRNA formyltransferase